MKEIQIPREGNPNPFGRKSKLFRKEIKGKSFHFLRRIEAFQGLTPTPHRFFLFEPLPGSNAPRQRERCSSGSDRFSSLLSSFRRPPVYRASEGLAPFRSRDAWTPFAPTSRPRACLGEKRESSNPRRIPRVVSPGTPRKRQGDRSDVRQECVRLKRARSGSGLWISARAPALHALRVSLECLSLSLIPSVRRAWRMRPLFVGRVHERLSSSDCSGWLCSDFL
jgi:hypothetical protein